MKKKKKPYYLSALGHGLGLGRPYLGKVPSLLLSPSLL